MNAICPRCGGLEPCVCNIVLNGFVDEMRKVLAANAYKGGRTGPDWQGPTERIICELLYHVAKLHYAYTHAERGEGTTTWDEAREHAGDVAVSAMMIWDRTGFD